MAILVWITLTVKDGNCHQVLELLDSPEGNDFTASQQGCERLERSVDHDNPNQILLTELWSSKEDWDAYFEMQQEVRDNNGFNKQLLELIEENREDFAYCHWLAKSEQGVYKTLYEMGMEGRLINSMAHEAHWYETAFRNSDKITPNLPENGYSW